MTITSEEFYAAIRQPDLTEIPTVFADHVTPELVTAIEKRDAAYDEWVDIEDEAVAAHHAAEAARKDDTQALREAVAAGKGDPGTANAEKADRAVVFHLERVRQAAARVRAADGTVRSVYRKILPTLVPTATRIVRDAVSSYRDSVTHAEQTLRNAERNLRTGLQALSEIRDIVRPLLQYTVTGATPDERVTDTNIGVLSYYESLADNIDAIADQID